MQIQIQPVPMASSTSFLAWKGSFELEAEILDRFVEAGWFRQCIVVERDSVARYFVALEG